MNPLKIFLLLLFFSKVATAQIPAFPGAEGWGALSQGGRGGVVLMVTNLNDSGPGSFRDAVSAVGARTVIFQTGGVIELLTEIQITDPYIYIAGQTAPGDGIVLKNFGLAVFTHDVTIRGLRIRLGDDLPALSPDNHDCIAVQPSSYNVIADHCSFSWGIDENVSVLGAGTHKVTFQWCIISEGLYANIHPKGFHSMGVLVGYDAEKVTLHHNLFAHNGGRNPLFLRQTDHEFINNFVYDWLYKAELLREDTLFKIDFAGNYYKPFSNNPYPELPIGIDFDSTSANGSQLYMTDNFYSAGMPFITPQQLSQMGGNATLFSSSSLLSSPGTVTIQNPFEARNNVMSWAGALHPQRDATDLRILQTVSDSIGGMLDCITSPILLDSGNVIGATDSTIIYSQFGNADYYSTESRKIMITSGPGAGQIRYGAMGINVIDTANVIIEGKITINWNTKPDSTSTYKFYAGCNNTLGVYPNYVQGSPLADSDNDGMPDSWESNTGLNPNDSTDHNGTNLDTSGLGYTNLEIYLNGFYSQLPTTDFENRMDESALQIFPNPFSSVTNIKINCPSANLKITVFNCLGQMVKQIGPLNIRSSQPLILYREELKAGLYFIKLFDNEKVLGTQKLLVTEK